ncbi:MAG: DNA replication and repair protein RecF [Ruminiclostridium sp.]|nr:DNA replication and repair protein RecF [Ruminiclostridium sp.]
MKIKKLYVKNFRNIREQEFEFHEGMNVLCGNNAQGKTNLCEAISLCMGPSFKGSRQSSYIPFSLDQTREKLCIKIWFTTGISDNENVIEFSIANGKKEILYNNIPMKSAMELYGVLKYVVFIPEHLNLIKGNPEMRRDYLDSVAMMQTTAHLKKLSRYNKALKNKNNILAGIYNDSDLDYIIPQIESWNEILGAEGLNVTYGRLKYFSSLKNIAGDLYKEISGGEELTLSYYSSVFERDDMSHTEVGGLLAQYLRKLSEDLTKEVKLRHTVSGVHRDDMNFYINGADAREYGSQGQQRSIALVLKLAEAEIIRRRDETPIMILDDVLSELDSNRQQFVLNNIVNSQVFITCCNIDDIKNLDNGKVWRVEKGEFTLM